MGKCTDVLSERVDGSSRRWPPTGQAEIILGHPVARERERKRERERERKTKRERGERERERVCVCVRERG